jgi:hypothetical protein
MPEYHGLLKTMGLDKFPQVIRKGIIIQYRVMRGLAMIALVRYQAPVSETGNAAGKGNPVI